MQERYEPQTIEPKWQDRWEAEGLFAAGRRGDLPKKYVLEMFPYPSGALHMGHVRNYLLGDVIARYSRMKGFDVLHPMGWDALGLPAENAAIKDKRHPAERTRENVRSFKAEMKRVGFSYDWSREISTDDPAYYKWSQWFFLKFRERGLVYRRMAHVNWCPGCQTVIANEQVKDGLCERSSDPVVIKQMAEWAFRITEYSERLLRNLDELKDWPEEVVKKQRNWIGKSEGAELDFAVDGSSEKVRVFTTRADTVFGCTYVVVAPDHPMLAAIVPADRREAVTAFAADQARKAATKGRDEELPKEGVDTGARAVHPFTGAKLPIWAANFVVSDYGTGAVMSVPAHDERDFEFATLYGLPIVRVIRPADGAALPADAAFTEDGVLENSGPYTGQTSPDARKAIAAAAKEGGFGGPSVTYRQRDWGISRQRYWGTPIPIVYCEACDPAGEGIAVPYDQLPVELPEIDVAAVLTGRGEPPLAKVPSFVNTTCPGCGGPARREVETMDTFVDSSWYFARYLDPKNDELPFSRSSADRWLPVDVYVGGPEHSTMHLLYFRFWTMVMQEMGLCAEEEPVKRLVTQGIVNGPDGRKMSKRWGNVVAPATIVDRYGADAARTFTMFAGPPDRDIQWSDEQVEGSARFLQRIWRLAYRHRDSAGLPGDLPADGRSLEIRRAAHKTLRRVTEDLERLSFNTAVARAMELVNFLTPVEPETDAERAAMAEAIRLLAAMLSPIAPHLAEEIAEVYGATRSLQATEWPAYDPALTEEDTRVYAVQVNGKLRGEVAIRADAGEDEVKAAAQADAKVAPHLAGMTVRKVIFVKGRLVNFVVSP
ncbi:leucine--tRNA ligase [Vulgatibacter incomptus]|uniref:Leucine--tRNA ligase n=1 Tax=Vulgatibacter incomptus TaxID=1391653 RepID=A0A0K1PAP4_9BACT|nr:leucine--tRNA ligase [Vulgatibacter incomptus]AKU90590.1 Leucyl-tRNA synthetase [Vulgatibacter incomptus]